MMIHLLAAAALAGPQATDELIYTVVDAIYGKPIPHEAVCIERPLFPEGMEIDAVAVAVKRGASGCKLLGVMVDGSFQTDLGDASAKAFADARWSSIDEATRERWLAEWTTKVVLAFEQVEPASPPRITRDRDGWTARVTSWRRSSERFVAEQVQHELHWTSARDLDRHDEAIARRSRLGFNARESRLDGVAAEGVHAGLESVGKVLGTCVKRAWTDNLGIHGRVRLQWTLAGGQAHKVAVVAQDDDGSGLAQCYARAISTIEFSPALAGTVVWAFNLVQTPLDDQPK